MAAPGQYTIHISLDGAAPVVSKPFNLMIDPRLAEQGVTAEVIDEHIALAQKVSDLLTSARKLEVNAIKNLNQLKAAYGDMPKEEWEPKIVAEFEKTKALLSVLQTEPDVIYPKPMLVSQISYLYNILNTADQKPGKDAYERFDELNQKYQEISHKYAE